MSDIERSLLTTAEAAHEITRTVDAPIREWQVRRMYEEGLLPDPPRFGQKRIVLRVSLPTIIQAMRKRGWLPAEPEADQP